MDNTMESLARTLTGLSRGGGDGLVMGLVRSVRPLRVLAEGNDQDRDSLLRLEGVDTAELAVGDRVALCPMEERQRYLILGRVVSV